MSLRPAWLTVGLVLGASLAVAAEVTVTAKPSTTSVTVGEAFTVEVECAGPAGLACDFPHEVVEEKIELHARAQARPVANRRTYDAAVFALGEVSVPAVGVSYKLPDGKAGQASSAPVALDVRSLLSRDPKEQQLADVRPPVALGIGRPFFVALGMLVVLLAGLAYGIWRWRRPAALGPARESVTPPDEAALEALRRLAASGRIEREEFRPFYIELTEVAKRYLEGRLEAPIVEMTSAEMIAFLRQHPRGAVVSDTMRDVSGAADQVKFARGQGARELAQGHLDAVGRLVARLEDVLRPEPPAAATKEDH